MKIYRCLLSEKAKELAGGNGKRSAETLARSRQWRLTFAGGGRTTANGGCGHALNNMKAGGVGKQKGIRVTTGGGKAKTLKEKIRKLDARAAKSGKMEMEFMARQDLSWGGEGKRRGEQFLGQVGCTQR